MEEQPIHFFGKQLELDFEEKNLFGARILLVDDNQMNILITKKFLTKWNSIVDCCDNGFQAVEVSNKIKFDLILMDIEMPEMDGFETTQLIRNKNEDIPVIALSASLSKSSKEKLLAHKINGFIPKPFKSEELYSQLKLFLH